MTETTVTEEIVREALRENVIDPEIGINIVDLGLVYGIEVADNVADITMTLTTPLCPLGPILEDSVKLAMEPLGVAPRINLVWEPRWDLSMMSEDARLELGFW
ncbi:MAG TPA: metal-sulfur cluster assembly factor [Chloroflexota bacterium]|nr:metal-sulfur cluster assembly factor [Chloroflexota bacterium]